MSGEQWMVTDPELRGLILEMADMTGGALNREEIGDIFRIARNEKPETYLGREAMKKMTGISPPEPGSVRVVAVPIDRIETEEGS